MAVSETDRFEIVNLIERKPRDAADRAERVEAKLAIDDVFMLYAHYCDSANWDRVCALYTDDVERVLSGTLDERVKGNAALKNLYLNPVLPRRGDGAALGGRAAGQGTRRGTVRHMMATPVIRLSDDGKEGWLTSYFSLVTSNETDAGFVRHVHEGTYIFSFVKQGEDWKISKMVVNTEIGNDPAFQPPK